MSTHTETLSTTARVFVFVAILEAISWVGLLTAMFFKYVIADDPNVGMEGGVPIAGPIHGAIFVIYLIMCLAAWKQFNWSAKTLLIGLIAAVPPFATIFFERHVKKTGKLLSVPAPEQA